MIEEPINLSEEKQELVGSEDITIDIETELYEIRGVFPDHGTEDFYRLSNGNVGTVLEFEDYQYEGENISVLVDYPSAYPKKPPTAWLWNPSMAEIENHPPLMIGSTECGGTEYRSINYTASWDETYTSFDVALMVKTWVGGFENWHKTGEWEEGDGHRYF